MVYYRRSLLLLSISCFLSYASAQDLIKSSRDPNWWKHATLYQIYPKSFKDSNNDGVGDLQGIIEKLDHLKDAGVTACWISPIYASPQVDAGYDISNYTDIHEEFGTLEDFDQLVARAKELGIRVVLDFVPNHSSDQHEWFVKSENREPGFEDYYVWKDPHPETGKEPNNWLSVFKYSAWKWSEKRQQYYLHQFDYRMPDLNFRNPKVVQEFKDILTFWMDRGVDGFRVDAAPQLFEHAGYLDEPLSGNPSVQPYEYGYLIHKYTRDQPETYELIYEFRQHLDDYARSHSRDTILLMTESYSEPQFVKPYHGDGVRLGAHFSFNFLFINYPTETAFDIVKTINSWMNLTGRDYTPNWVLGNHDVQRAATRYGTQNTDGMNMLVGMLPGVQVTYNGEEIGMEKGEVTFEQGQDPSGCNASPEDFDKYSRDSFRTPYHWDGTVNAGFNRGAKTWLPVSPKYLTNNLALQKEQERSHFKVYKVLMELRQREVLARGDFEVEAVDGGVVAIRRKLKWHASLVFLFNKSEKKSGVDLMKVFPGVEAEVGVVLTSLESPRKIGNLLFSDWIELEPHESLILEEAF